MESKTLDIQVDLPDCSDCERCLERFRRALSMVKGVDEVKINPRTCGLTLFYDPQVASPARLQEAAQGIGADISRKYAHETIPIVDMDCADCATSLERAVGRIPGVVHAGVNFTTAKMTVEYEPAITSHGEIVSSIRAHGYEVSKIEQDGKITSLFRITGLDCADCASAVERNVASQPGVIEARVNFGLAQLMVRHRADVTAEAIVRNVESSGYGARLEGENPSLADRPFWRSSKWAILTAASGASLGGGVLASVLFRFELVAIPLFVLAMALGGYRAARSGIFSLTTSRSMDMNLLMTIAAIGAAAIGQWVEGAVVVFLFSLGNTLEAYTMDRARKAIGALMTLSPQYATLRRDNREIVVPVEQVGVGELATVRPGERIPMDGQVIEGASTVNQAPITGESMPVEKSVGDEVFAGTINEHGYLEILVTKPYQETTISRIIRLVEEAQAQKAPSQRFVDKFASYYTPSVLALSAGVAILPWLVLGDAFQPWFYRALVLLVIACPCALVISTPVSIVSGIARAAREGVLVKGGVFLEELARTKLVAFDKTGTLTQGKPRVAEVVSLKGLSDDELLSLAAAVESRSEHPLAAAVLRRAKHSDLDIRRVDEFEPLAGKGVKAKLNGKTYYVGSPSLFRSRGLDLGQVEGVLSRWDNDGRTALVVGTESEILGALAVADEVRENAAAVVRELHLSGVDRIVMLTGDSDAAARSVAEKLGIDDVRALLLPHQKVDAIRALRGQHGAVAMIGDGVNDAPALAAANVGIAMGVAGTDAALETADVALMSDDLNKIPYAIELSRKCLSTIRQNVVLSLTIKIAFLLLTFAGSTTLWLAILADMGASLLVTSNSMRLLRYRARTSSASSGTHTDCCAQ